MVTAIPIHEIMDGSTQNIVDIYRTANEIQKLAGENWYFAALAQAEELADKHNLKVENVAYAIAALSANTDWITNQIAIIEVVEKGFTRFQTGMNNDKALQCLQGNLSALKGPKVTRFAEAIIDPLGVSTAVVDRHAYSIFMNEKQTDKQLKVLGRKGAYELVADSYLEASKILDVPVHTVQAVTWTVWRDKHDVVRKIGK